MDLPPPRIIGHRGAAAHAPENTLAGLRRARQLGARWVEFDVQATRDGMPVLLHDARLERTTDGYGLAADRTAADIARLDAGRWFGAAYRGERVPSLAAALAVADEMGLGAVIEVKAGPGDGPRTMRAALAVLRERHSPTRHIVSSFDEDALALAAAEAHDIPRALIVGAVPADWSRRLARLGCSALHAGERGLTAAMAAEAAAAVPLRVYTVNAASRARALFGWGVAAVFTDCPDVLISAVGHGSEGSVETGFRGSQKN
jgi:glycerophosphoryl diester phosphodiesterase